MKSQKIDESQNAVHLNGIRRNDTADGECQTGCLLFWKEVWLRLVCHPDSGTDSGTKTVGRDLAADLCGIGDERYRCPETDRLEATTSIRWQGVWYYAKGIVLRNVRMRDFVRHATARVAIAVLQSVIRLNWRDRRYLQHPMLGGGMAEKTPSEVVSLKPGERMDARSKNEIMRTLNAGQKNCRLWYDEEMLPYYNKGHWVLASVERVIDEVLVRVSPLISILGLSPMILTPL